MGDFINYLLIAGIGIGLLIAYSRKKKPGLLWSGIGLLATGLILGNISPSKAENPTPENTIVRPKRTPIEPEEALAEYKGVIEFLLEHADTTTTDTVISFFSFDLNLPSHIIYDNELDEPMLLVPDSLNDLVVTFKEENKKDYESLDSYSESIVEILQGNGFSSSYQFSNKQVAIEGKVIQYDYSKSHRGIEVIKGETFFAMRNGKLFRITISKMGISPESLSNETKALKERIVDNLLQQSI